MKTCSTCKYCTTPVTSDPCKKCHEVAASEGATFSQWVEEPLEELMERATKIAQKMADDATAAGTPQDVFERAVALEVIQMAGRLRDRLGLDKGGGK